jgi:hypothetical protein
MFTENIPAPGKFSYICLRTPLTVLPIMDRLNNFLRAVILTLPCLFQASVIAQTFQKTNDTFEPVYSGKINWVDLDSDNDLDLLYCGHNGSAGGTHIYRNDNGNFVAVAHNLPAIRNGGFSLADFDGDNDQDILLSGLGTTGNISALYQNNGNFSFALDQSFEGLTNSIPSWFDIDNDGDLDFLFAGVDDTGPTGDPFIERTIVYENQAGTFVELSGTGLPACSQCAVEWADANADGLLDVIMSGIRSDGLGRTSLHINNGNKTFRRDTNIKLKNVINGDIKWADFDKDGDPDVLQTGTEEGKTLIYSTVFENQGTWKTRSDITVAAVGENWFGGTSWFDYNNDGFLDMILSGRENSTLEDGLAFEIFRGDGSGGFTSTTNLEGVTDSSVDFGDFDNDGDIDICFLGQNAGLPTVGVYENMLINAPFAANAKPAPPSTGSMIESELFRNLLTLDWADGTDTKTPSSSLTYNVYMRSGQSDIIVPPSSRVNGYLKTSLTPNAQGGKLRLKNVPEGDLYWSVQSIDGAKAGSLFSPEKHFYHIYGPQAIKAEITDPTHVKLYWSDNSLIETGYRIEKSAGDLGSFSAIANLPANASDYTDVDTFQEEISYHYRIYSTVGPESSGYDSLMIIVPATPGTLTAKSLNSTTISLKWEDKAQSETDYVIERKKPGEPNFTVIATLYPNKSAYTDQSLSEGTYYEYRVKTVNKYGSSTYTPIVSAVTNFRPSANDFDININEDELVVFTKDQLSDQFTDPDNADVLTSIRIESLPEFGTLTLNGANVNVNQVIGSGLFSKLRYTPGADENGSVSITYRVSDGKDLSLQSNTIQITVHPVNDAPVFFFTEAIELTEDFGGTETFSPFASGPENENSQTVNYSIEPTTSDFVNISFDESTGTLEATAEANAYGSMTFTLTANDGSAENGTYSQDFTITVYPVNDAPVVQPLGDVEVVVGDDVPSIPAAVTDPDNDFFSLIISATSSNQDLIPDGNIIVDFDGESVIIGLTPLNGQVGETVVTVTADDGEGSSMQTFTFSVVPVMGVEYEVEQLQFAPNPVQSELFVQGGKVGLVEIKTTTGATSMMALVDGKNNSVDVRKLQPGVYIVRFADRHGKMAVGKFIKL